MILKYLLSHSIFNLHTQLYTVLNVSIALVEVITLTTEDKIDIVPESVILINNLVDYGLTISTPRDSLMMLT